MTAPDQPAADDWAEAEFIPAAPRVRFRFAPAVEVGGRIYDRIELRQPTGEDLEAAEKFGGSVKSALTLIQRVSGLPAQVVAKLPGAVLERASTCLSPPASLSEPLHNPNAREGA